MKKYYEVATTNGMDEFVHYAGADLEEAKKVAFRTEKYQKLENRYYPTELREYDVPDNFYELDEDEQVEILCNSLGYNLVPFLED